MVVVDDSYLFLKQDKWSKSREQNSVSVQLLNAETCGRVAMMRTSHARMKDTTKRFSVGTYSAKNGALHILQIQFSPF